MRQKVTTLNSSKGFAPILIIFLIALGIGGYFLISNYSKNQSEATRVTIQTTVTPNLQNTYSSETTLFSYTETDSRIIRSSKLDDCSEKSDFYLQEPTGKKLILETVSGCIEYTKPRYVGFTDSKRLIFSLYHEIPDFSKSKPNFEISTIKEIYSIDPLTLERKLIMESSIIPKGITRAEIVDENRKFISLFDQEKYVAYSYNILDKQFYKSPI